MKIQIILTGTGAGEAPHIGEEYSYKRHHSCALFKIKTKGRKFCFHIDFTSFAADGLVSAGVLSSEIDALFFTHGHEDHCFSYRWLSAMLGIQHIHHPLDPKFGNKLFDIIAPRPVIETIAYSFSNKAVSFDKKFEYGDNLMLGFRSQINNKEILRMHGVEKNAKINFLSGDVTVKCIGVKHSYDSALSPSGRGEMAFGFLVTIRENGRSFNIFYLSDFEHFKIKNSCYQDIADYELDVCILGMPIPFPDKVQKKRHMGLKETLAFCRFLKSRGVIGPRTPIILNHLSYRWDIPEIAEKAKKTISKYWLEKNKVLIPKEDGFKIIYDNRRIKMKGKIIKNN